MKIYMVVTNQQTTVKSITNGNMTIGGSDPSLFDEHGNPRENTLEIYLARKDAEAAVAKYTKAFLRTADREAWIVEQTVTT